MKKNIRIEIKITESVNNSVIITILKAHDKTSDIGL